VLDVARKEVGFVKNVWERLRLLNSLFVRNADD
jgi:hypothetical protein